MSALTIVMYHYVRNLAASRYPEIKGLSVEQFEGQVAYLKKHYNPITAFDLMDAIESGSSLPSRSVLLTFDDGYIDHFTEVFPILDREGLSGCFFPPAKCIVENRVLDVNKIHFILASTPDKDALVSHIRDYVTEHRDAHGLDGAQDYWDRCGVANRFDTAEVIFVKRMLQRELPENVRATLTDELFHEFVRVDEQTFARELYMSKDQIMCLQRNGMYVGSHSYEHSWLNTLAQPDQRREIDLSLDFLASIGSDIDRWIMCYPYGGYNDGLLSLLAERNCVCGLTSVVGLADSIHSAPLTLPRLDTNDLPRSATADPNEWTQRATASSSTAG